MRVYNPLPFSIETDDFSIKFLESAIRFNQFTLVKMLVGLGAPLGVVKSEAKERTPLHIAAWSGNHQICEYLLLKGASTSLLGVDGYTAMDLAIANGHQNVPGCSLVCHPSIRPLRIKVFR